MALDVAGKSRKDKFETTQGSPRHKNELSDVSVGKWPAIETIPFIAIHEQIARNKWQQKV